MHRYCHSSLPSGVAVFAVALALLSLPVGCTLSEEVVTRHELCVSAVASMRTKSYVEAGTLVGTPSSSLHPSGAPSPRTIYMTSWLHPQSGAEGEYFRSMRFSMNANGETDGLWHHPGVVYWPIDGTLDMLAFSCDSPFPESSVAWGLGNSTDELSLSVDASYTQDDILFSFVGGASNVSGAAPSVPMVFSHAQAWIQFVFHTSSAELDNIITLFDVTIRDIFTEGILRITHPFGVAEGQWSYRYAVSRDTVVDDNNDIYGTRMTTTPVYLDMLLPEQAKKDFVLCYTIEGSDPIMYYVYPISGSTWQMGKKYVYDITFSPTGIAVETGITDWTGGGVEEANIPE